LTSECNLGVRYHQTLASINIVEVPDAIGLSDGPRADPVPGVGHVVAHDVQAVQAPGFAMDHPESSIGCPRETDVMTTEPA